MTDIPSTSESFDYLPDISIPHDDTSGSPEQKETSGTSVLPSKCRICSNPAVGYHYDVASCNGCKAFFRRTMITGRRYKCSARKRCLEEHGGEEDLPNKRLCGACRFEKCVQMGMNPMAIQAALLSSEGELMKEEILKRRNLDHLPIQTMNVEDELSRAIQKLTMAEGQLEKLHNSRFPVSHGDFRSLSDILATAPIFEVDRIPNLSHLPSQTFPGHADYAHNSLLSIVEHTKLLDLFSNLEIESARKIINHGAVMVRNLVMSYHSLRTFHSDIIRRPDGSIAGKPLRNYNGVWVEHQKIIQKTLHAFMRNELDTVEYMLLKVIVLCNPTIFGLPVADQKIIEKERIRYARCLFTYCLKQHGTLDGPNRYASILSMVSIMEQQQKEQKSFYVLLRSCHKEVAVLVSPLYDEIMESS